MNFLFSFLLVFAWGSTSTRINGAFHTIIRGVKPKHRFLFTWPVLFSFHGNSNLVCLFSFCYLSNFPSIVAAKENMQSFVRQTRDENWDLPILFPSFSHTIFLTDAAGKKKSMPRKKVQGSIIVWTNESQFSFSFFFANQVCSIPVLSVRVNYLVAMEIGHCWLLKQVVVMVIMACGQPSMFFFYFEWECLSSS